MRIHVNKANEMSLKAFRLKTKESEAGETSRAGNGKQRRGKGSGRAVGRERDRKHLQKSSGEVQREVAGVGGTNGAKRAEARRPAAEGATAAGDQSTKRQSAGRDAGSGVV